MVTVSMVAVGAIIVIIVDIILLPASNPIKPKLNNSVHHTKVE